MRPNDFITRRIFIKPYRRSAYKQAALNIALGNTVILLLNHWLPIDQSSGVLTAIIMYSVGILNGVSSALSGLRK